MPSIPLRTPANIGALIKGRRRALQLDQADLARMIGVSRLWVNQVERAKPGASLGLALRALDALSVELGAADRARTASIFPITTPDIDAIVAKACRTSRA